MEELNPYFDNIQRELGAILYKRKRKRQVEKKRTKLQKINFGEYVAEEEEDMLQYYFIETGFVKSLKRKKFNMIVGRKGMGKTATLFYLLDEFLSEKINHVCLIMPENFELDRLMSIIETTRGKYVEGHLIEAIWKFLIYTELGKSLYKEIKAKPSFAKIDAEKEFEIYIEERKELFLNDIAVRIEEQIGELTKLEYLSNESVSSKELLRISEILHNNIIQELRGWFVDIIPKNHNLILLIDNLDKSWTRNSDIETLSRYILGLLDVSKKIIRDLSVVKTRKTGISFKLSLFLRSDIYKYILENAREPDKLDATILRWDDSQSFFHIIEERFVELHEDEVEVNELWDDYLVKEVNGMPLKKYILNKVIPRPRDIIYFFKQALETAIIRKHTIIEESDVELAYEKYSAWVMQTILVENGITIPQMENFLLSLTDLPEIILKREIMDSMEYAGLNKNDDDLVNYFINHIFKLSVIGKEVKKNDFRFDYGTEDTRKIDAMSQRLNSKRFLIHPAFHHYLEIQKSN